MSEKIIGIDLGTATTEAALFTDGQVHMIPNPDQENRSDWAKRPSHLLKFPLRS